MKKHNDQILGDVLKEMMNNKRLKPKLYSTKIQEAWPRLMGASISGYTTNIYLRARKVYINIESAPLKQELNYSKDKILNLLNKELGEEYLLDVIIR